MTLTPHKLAAVLLGLGREGIALAPEGDSIRYSPTPPPDLLAGLREHKAAVLGLLADGADVPNGEAPGSPAWLLAVGDAMQASGADDVPGWPPIEDVPEDFKPFHPDYVGIEADDAAEDEPAPLVCPPLDTIPVQARPFYPSTGGTP